MANFNRSKMGGGGRFGKKNFAGRDERPQMHDAVCSKCGKRCQVPFRPTGARPIFCSDCFEKERDSMPQRDGERNFDRRDSGRGNFEERRMYSATCSNCGKKCEVPFLPSGGRPTYCKECYDKGVVTTDQKHDDERRDRKFSDSNNNSGNNFKQIEALNAKLDKIISLLMAKAPAPEPVKKEAEKAVTVSSTTEKIAKKIAKKVAAPKKPKKK